MTELCSCGRPLAINHCHKCGSTSVYTLKKESELASQQLDQTLIISHCIKCGASFTNIEDCQAPPKGSLSLARALRKELLETPLENSSPKENNEVERQTLQRNEVSDSVQSHAPRKKQIQSNSQSETSQSGEVPGSSEPETTLVRLDDLLESLSGSKLEKDL